MMLHEVFAYSSLVIIFVAFLVLFFIDWLLRGIDFPGVNGNRQKIKYIRSGSQNMRNPRCKLILRLDYFLKILIILFLLLYVVAYFFQEVRVVG